ncbi:hypothetical protein CDLVIII_1470 [Clostridium sp. DL-VIII]|uniref:hypothetical protein n=1 Tax=Clostridium sp. DL-VIII TaxID=641107 RepID=UPI00023AF0A7|nr:hypothetical protein [Clostridium sp. DL-VIII]EHI98163.1 hypothetical protein CDLVIII_1470 [Clostridium sp. DL-VIII]
MPSLKEVSLGIMSLNRKDIDDDYMKKIRSRAYSIEKFIGNNENTFDLLCQFILANKSKADYEKNFESWVEQVHSVNKTFKIDNIESFIDSIKNAFEDSEDDDQISDLRGRLFEVILEKLYSEKYKDTRLKRSIFNNGCEIKIRKKEIHYKNLKVNKSKKTVDIAGYNLDNSEFYEAKVGPGNFDGIVIEYLNLLNSILLKEQISKSILVGCMTMEIKARLKQNLMKVKRLENIDYIGLELLGREEIKRIISKS